MKWCRFQSGRTTAYGIIDDTTVTEVTGNPFESYTKTATIAQLSRVKLLVPVIPPTFYAAGVNYREHVTEMAHRRGVKPEFPPAADVGYRANNALVPTDEPIAPNRSGTAKVDALMTDMRTPTASPIRPAGAILCNSDITIGCALPSASPSVNDSVMSGATLVTNGNSA